MKKDNVKKSFFKASTGDKDPWINVHDDDLMVSLGIRAPHLKPRDPSVWQKTTAERKLLKKLRRKNIRLSGWAAPSRSIPVQARLILYLKKNKVFSKSTYSSLCWQHNIPQVISRYALRSKKTGAITNLVSKYCYNGKMYNPGEFPFWYV